MLKKRKIEISRLLLDLLFRRKGNSSWKIKFNQRRIGKSGSSWLLTGKIRRIRRRIGRRKLGRRRRRSLNLKLLSDLFGQFPLFRFYQINLFLFFLANIIPHPFHHFHQSFSSCPTNPKTLHISAMKPPKIHPGFHLIFGHNSKINFISHQN